MNKLYPITALFLLFVQIQASAQINLPKENQNIKFTWLSDTVNHKIEPYSALLIPVKLNNNPNTYYMQFDLGAPKTFFYKEQLSDLLKKKPKTDTTTFKIESGKGKQQIIIGTIGEDMIDGRTLIIDYPNRQLKIQTDVPNDLTEKTKLSNFMLMKGSVLFPAILNSKQTILFFDTGSSAFELLASKATSDILAAPNTTTESYPVKSWGRTLTANTRSTNDSLSLASNKLPIKKVTYIDGASDSQVQQMLKLGIGGMIGNKLFLKSILIIDTKNKRFGIVN